MEEKTRTLQVGVKILLKNNAGQFLMVHRSLEKYPDAQGRWDIVGGRINPGYPLIENLRREIKEETGLEFSAEPRLIAAQDILRNPERHVVRLTYIGNAINENIVLDTSENDMYKWYTKEKLLKLDDVDVYFKELLKQGILTRGGL
jgi:ADP-ribose pyrophosphatase YjhB (NUDIX family)